MVEKVEQLGFAVQDVPGHSKVTLKGEGKRGETITITFDVQREVRVTPNV
jgi:Mitochondrial glycoprotein